MSTISRFILTFVPLTAMLAGCGGTPMIYQDNSQSLLGESLTPKNTWLASGDVTTPASAIDGQVDTLANSGASYAGATFTIDLGRSCVFQTIILDHGRNEDGYAATVEVFTSTDGRIWQPEYVTIGTRRATILSLPKPTLARYLRLRALRPGPGPWSLAEVYLQ